jgi:hypothetical protein
VTENFKTADVIGVFVRENNTVELLRRYATLLQTQHDLPRAETAINEDLAMMGCDQRAVSRAPAAKHGQAEHGSQDSGVISFCANEKDKMPKHEWRNDEGMPKHFCGEMFVPIAYCAFEPRAALAVVSSSPVATITLPQI